MARRQLSKPAKPDKPDPPEKPAPASVKKPPHDSQPKPWTVYILLCGDGSYYIGITNDPVKRLKLHEQGKASRYTRGRQPVRYVYQEPATRHGEALRREYALKRLTRPEKNELVKSYQPPPAPLSSPDQPQPISPPNPSKGNRSKTKPSGTKVTPPQLTSTKPKMKLTKKTKAKNPQESS